MIVKRIRRAVAWVILLKAISADANTQGRYPDFMRRGVH